MAFFQSALGRQLALGAGMAMVLGIMAAVWMWNLKPDYRVLLSNYSDRDGGAIVAALQQMNIPYQFSEGGSAILVPAERVNDARLKLASQGLPKGGNVGFELLENQKLGVSQFLEQVNFQRATEGELSRTINSIASVESSRVHLAIPKPSVFVRDKERPTASVLLNLRAGRRLDRQQVTAILHLVASSVPDLTTANVTVVDQNGELLSDPETQASKHQLDPQQLKYITNVQDSIVKRIESILTPMMGVGNVRAEASAEVDFTSMEQAAETYKPNGMPDDAAMRSQHTNESTTAEATKAAGVPGAASNQPGQKGTTPPAVEPPPTPTQKDNTTNYELDKTVRYVQQAMGGIKRLNVAVLVNNKREVAADGKVTLRPLTADEKTQITDLVKEAMGFNKERGDSLSVANSAFTEPTRELIPEEPFWKPYANLDTAKTAGQYGLTAAVLMYLFFGVLRPLIKKATATTPPPAKQAASNPEGGPAMNNAPIAAGGAEPLPGYDADLLLAKQLATQEPKVVANVVKNWVNSNE